MFTKSDLCPECLDDPTGYGRILREGDSVIGIVEQKDADEDQQAIREINTGVMLCPAARLRTWLDNLGNDNAQGEYYLTDVVAMAVAEGVAVRGIKADNWTEVMGINDKKQLAEAERALQARLVGELMQQGVGFADPAGAHHVTVPHHRDAIADGEDLGHPVRDVDHRNPVAHQIADHREEGFDLGVGQRSGRFVHDQQAGASLQGAGDRFDMFGIGRHLNRRRSNAPAR